MDTKIYKKSFKEISNRVKVNYRNDLLETINDHCLRMSVMKGEYKWHYHANTDELFIILEGQLKIEIKGGETVCLKPGEFIKIPSKTIHRTSAVGRTVNLCFEKNAEDTIFTE